MLTHAKIGMDVERISNVMKKQLAISPWTSILTYLTTCIVSQKTINLILVF